MSATDDSVHPDLDHGAQRRAIECARRGLPSPNPHVGAVIVRDGEIIAEGWHERAGDDHAEVVALRAAGPRARGATVYVTLEPCNHHGRTPPCTEALIRAGVARVVFASSDPNPHVAGGGRVALSAAGIEVHEGFAGSLHGEAERVIAPWRTFITRGRAHVTLKVAMTLDGRIATRAGESRWITGPDARRDVHALRASCDAVLVGSRTVLADDPELTVRHVSTARQPARVVIDSELVTPPASKLASSAGSSPVWVLTRRDHPQARAEALRAKGVEVVGVDAIDGRVDLNAALKWLASRGVVSALCEGGGALHGAFLDQGLGERVVAYVAPVVFGGAAALAFGGRGVAAIADARRLREVRVERVGEDLRIEGEL